MAKMVLKLIPLVVGNLTRKKLRSGLTLLSVVIAFVHSMTSNA